MKSLSAQRLRIARKCYGWAQDRLRDQEQWRTHVKGVVSPRAIINWEKKGIPDEKLEHVAACFKIPAFLFVDETITDNIFRSIVLMKKDGQEFDITSYIRNYKASSINENSYYSKLSEKLGVEIANVLHKEIFIKSTQTNIHHLTNSNVTSEEEKANFESYLLKFRRCDRCLFYDHILYDVNHVEQDIGFNPITKYIA